MSNKETAFREVPGYLKRGAVIFEQGATIPPGNKIYRVREGMVIRAITGERYRNGRFSPTILIREVLHGGFFGNEDYASGVYSTTAKPHQPAKLEVASLNDLTIFDLDELL